MLLLVTRGDRRGGSARGGAGAAPRSMTASSGATVSVLLEREAELARVDRLLDRVAVGAGAVVVVEGPVGIGKSELLAVIRERSQARGFGVLAARGSEFEAEIAFGVARQLFEPLLRGAPSSERRRLLDGVARVGARALGVEPGEPPADRFAAIHGLFWLCANRAERAPLVVSVDDVQWADDSSLAWLGYLVRRAEDLAVLPVLGLRSGDPSAARDELAGLVEDRCVERLVLGPLSASAVGAIVRAQLDGEADEPFCAACYELTGGNPLFVRELLAAAVERGLAARHDSVVALRRIAPRAVGSSVLARLGRLGGEAVALARAVAVLGSGAEVALAARLAGIDPVVAELTADRLALAQILAPARPLDFLHPLVGAAVREQMASGALRIAHRRAAELLDREGGKPLGHIAAHLLECGPSGDEWVVERLRDATIEGLDRGAPEIAARYARRALAEPAPPRERAALLFLLGTAEWRTGQSEAIAHLEQALAAAGDDTRTVIASCSALALAHSASDRAERSVEVLELARRAAGDRTATLAPTGRLGTIEPAVLREPGLALTAEAALVLAGINNERTAATAWRRAEKLQSRLATAERPSIYLLVTLAYCAARENRAAEAQELIERALEHESYPPPLEGCVFVLVTLNLVECYEELYRVCEDLLASARRRGALQELAAISAFRASASCDRGALADAEADARWALERAEPIHRMHAISELVRVLIEQDELEAAEYELEQLGNPLESRSDEMVRFLIARGQLRVAQSRPREALQDFLDCGQRCARLGRLTPSAAPWRSEAALAYAALEDEDQARRLAAEQLELARAFGRPRTLGLSLRACGLIERGETGLKLVHESVNTLEGSQSPLELARARSDYGAALRRMGRRVQARAELERALDVAHGCGARRIAARARAELIAAGAKPRRDAITGRDALTAAELRVARLAAQGLSNRDIAQALFITTKTAKAHLNRVYRKLGITRRAQLPDALAGQVGDAAGTSIAAGAIS
jgi:DNA-binding CsgD family transcriptional regulator